MARWRTAARAIRRVPGVSPGTRSLHRHLLLWLLLPQLVLWLAAALFTYALADRYANRAIDDSLSTASRALARQLKPSGNGLLIDFPRAAQDIIEADPEDRAFYMVSSPPGMFILGNHSLPAPPLNGEPQLGTPYFFDARVPDAASEGTPSTRGRRLVGVRVVALYLAYGEPDRPQRMLVQVARSRASREKLAREILVDTALPLSGLIVLMSLIVWAGIRAGLAPLARLRALVEDQAPNDLAPIRLEVAPEEVRSLARALNALLAQVRDSVATQKQFISDAAHQLRTPLAGLKSQAELALAAVSATAEPELHARLQRVQQSAARSAHLVAQLLALARAEPESAMVQARSRFDLRRLARDVAAEQVPRALAAGIDLGFDDDEEHAAPPPLDVDGNALLVREAIANLIDNAIRYAGAGSSVTLHAHADGAAALLMIEDTGDGLPDWELEHVFERFVRATHTGNGCGLGLAIVKEIVERHAGRIRLEAVKPHGVRAVLRLPLALNPAVNLQHQQFQRRPMP